MNRAVTLIEFFHNENLPGSYTHAAEISDAVGILPCRHSEDFTV